MSDTAQRQKAIAPHPAVYRFLSSHSLGTLPETAGRPIVYLHIPKTGGTFLTDVIIHNLRSAENPDLFYAPHAMSAAGSAQVFGSDRRLALVLRDPISRFASAFYSRKRQGLPGYRSPWSPAEERAFRAFPDLGALVRALISPSPKRRRKAREVIDGMRLVPRGYAHAFGSVDQVRAELPNIVLCLPIEAMRGHLDEAMRILGFETYTLPPDPVANIAPAGDPELTWTERLILRRYLDLDYRIYDVLRTHAGTLHGL